MSEYSVRSSFPQKVRAAGRILADQGLGHLFQAVSSNIAFHLSSKWRFRYFAFPLDVPTPSFSTKEPITVRTATADDLERIEAEIFPALTGDMEYEKRYFQLIGEPQIKCFLAQYDGKLVHYSWVFLDATRSLLADVPFDRRKLDPNDAFIGPVFTLQSARGLIYFHALAAVLDYLKNETGAKRAIVFFDGKNPAAASFYQRIGFTEIVDAQPKSMFSFLRQRLIRSVSQG